MINAADFVKWLEVFNVDFGPGAGTGTVDPGLINELAYYAAAGDTVSGLTTANNGLLSTDGSGVPSIGNAIGADITVNGITVGLGNNGISSNTAVGNGALGSITSGSNNSGFGLNALAACTSGSNNGAYGAGALSSLTTNNNNHAVGLNALGSLQNGAQNVAFGNNTGLAVATGAVALLTGVNNTFLGQSASANVSTAGGVIAIGSDSVAEGATGATSGDNGPGIALGSAARPVGFRGDGTIYPSAGTSLGYMRVNLNGTNVRLLVMADA